MDVLGALAGGIETSFFAPVATPGAIGSYGIGSGTSYAAPEVAGAAALVWAANPLLDAAGVAATIESAASGNGIWTHDLAWGNLNVAAAVERYGEGLAAIIVEPVAAVERAASGTPPELTQPVAPAKPKALAPPKKAKVAPTGRPPKRARPRPG